MKLALILLFLFIGASSRTVFDALDEEGYGYETLIGVTPDGFELTIVRITSGKTAASKLPFSQKPAVLLQHGLLDDCCTWIANLPHQSLGYLLTDAGYDVFMGNVRGNRYSMNNRKVEPNSKKFWSLVDIDYMISQDIPTMIDAALEASNKTTLTYIGHSQGTMVGFGAFTSIPTLRKKVNLYVALSPIVFVGNIKVSLLRFLSYLDAVGILEYFGEEAFIPSSHFIHWIAGAVCGEVPNLCDNLLGSIVGPDPQNINQTRLPYILSMEPGGTSVQNMAHWAQLVNSGSFQKFDFKDANVNMKHYGVPYAPRYHIEDMEAPPMAFFSGGKDLLGDPSDYAALMMNLKTKPILTHFEPTYNHIDFVWGVNAYQKIYPSIFKLLAKYNRLE